MAYTWTGSKKFKNICQLYTFTFFFEYFVTSENEKSYDSFGIHLCMHTQLLNTLLNSKSCQKNWFAISQSLSCYDHNKKSPLSNYVENSYIPTNQRNVLIFKATITVLVSHNTERAMTPETCVLQPQGMSVGGVS